MNELTINGFSALSEEEMMMIDAGGWIRAVCCEIGAIGGGVIGYYTSGIAGIIAGVGLGLACGDEVGEKIEAALAS